MGLFEIAEIILGIILINKNELLLGLLIFCYAYIIYTYKKENEEQKEELKLDEALIDTLVASSDKMADEIIELKKDKKDEI